MRYYKTCPQCGAHLDPGEKCDCTKNTALTTTHEDGIQGGNTKVEREYYYAKL